MGAVLEKIPAPDAYFGGEALSEALSKAFVNELFEHYEKKTQCQSSSGCCVVKCAWGCCVAFNTPG